MRHTTMYEGEGGGTGVPDVAVVAGVIGAGAIILRVEGMLDCWAIAERIERTAMLLRLNGPLTQTHRS